MSNIPQLMEGLEREIAEKRRELEILQAKLSILREVEGGNKNGQSNKRKASPFADAPRAPAPRGLTIIGAGTEGMQALGEFSRLDLEAWVRMKYPHLKFTLKSLDKPVAAAMHDGRLQRTQMAIGNHPARYRWIADDPTKRKV